MNTIETLAFGATGLCLASAYLRWHRWNKQQITLRWFYHKQSNILSAQSELVREQLFQKAFTLRRAIELCSTNNLIDGSTKASQGPLDQCLEMAESLANTLERVSDELSAPFLEDSLPLALQHLLKHWANEVPDVEVALALPSEWPLGATDKHRLILWCVRECLENWKCCLDTNLPAVLSLALHQTNGIAKLHLGFTGQGDRMIRCVPIVAEQQHIQQIFRMVMPGHVKLRHNLSGLVWEFSWPLLYTGEDIEQVTE